MALTAKDLGKMREEGGKTAAATATAGKEPSPSEEHQRPEANGRLAAAATDAAATAAVVPVLMNGMGLTEAVIAATGPEADARLAEVMPALIRHLHGFAVEVGLTVNEWFAGVEFINQCGQMSDGKRNETQLLCNVLGLETLVDVITSQTQHGKPDLERKAALLPLPCTPSNILGPFYRPNAPVLSHGSWMVSEQTRSAWPLHTTLLTGRVLSSSTGLPIAGATLDVWHAAPSGMYEQQEGAGQPAMDLRGRFMTGPDGMFAVRCLRPAAYPIPDDGPVGALLGQLDRHPWRPAHIHVIVSAGRHVTLTTQLYDAEGGWLADDSVFAARRELVVRFVPVEDETLGVRWSVDFDFVLAEE